MKYCLALVVFWLVLCGFTLIGTLRWQSNSNNEDGFIIEQNVAGGLYSEIGRTAAGVSFFNVQIMESRKVCWRVRAFNLAGTTAPSSARCVSRWSVTIN